MSCNLTWLNPFVLAKTFAILNIFRNSANSNVSFHMRCRNCERKKEKDPLLLVLMVYDKK